MSESDVLRRQIEEAEKQAATSTAASASNRPTSRRDTRARLQDLADNAESESVRLNATKALAELAAEERARREASRPSAPKGALDGVADDALADLHDQGTAADLATILRGDGSPLAAAMPATRAVVDGHMERVIADRVAAELARLAEPAEFERRVEARAAELADERAARIVEDRVAAMREELAEQSKAAAKAPETPPDSGPTSTPQKHLGWPEDRPQRVGLLGGRVPQVPTGLRG